MINSSDMKAAQPRKNWQGEVKGGSGGGGIAGQRVESRVIIQSVMRPSSAKGRVNNVNTILKYDPNTPWTA